jgi:hypothetical protein
MCEKVNYSSPSRARDKNVCVYSSLSCNSNVWCVMKIRDSLCVNELCWSQQRLLCEKLEVDCLFEQLYLFTAKCEKKPFPVIKNDHVVIVHAHCHLGPLWLQTGEEDMVRSSLVGCSTLYSGPEANLLMILMPEYNTVQHNTIQCIYYITLHYIKWWVNLQDQSAIQLATWPALRTVLTSHFPLMPFARVYSLSVVLGSFGWKEVHK